jgi:hypothetical protein
MEIPGLGEVTSCTDIEGSYQSEPLPVPVLGGKICRVIAEEYENDPNKSEFHTAISNFLSIGPEVLRAVEQHIYQYYKDTFDILEPDPEEDFVIIKTPADVWQHIEFGDCPVVSRRPYRDKKVFVSLECECAWEEEHGLQIVFRNGLTVNKIGPFDGHLTNSDAYADDSREDLVYVGG